METVRREIAAFCGCAVMVWLGSSCSSADVDLGRRSRGSAGNAAVVTAADGGTMAAAGNRGNSAGAHAGSTAGNTSQAGASAGMSGITGRAGTGAADGGAVAGATAGAGGSASPLPGSRGCGLDPPAADTKLQVSGMSATYIVDVPSNYDKTRPYPLVFAFKDADVTAEQFRGSLNLPSAAGADAILVHPNCLGDASAWNVQRDAPLFDMLLTQTVARYCVDERRVFAAGHGFGGYFASMLGCLRADKLRAVATFAPGVPPNNMCQGDTAVWIAQGNADTPTAIANGRSTRDFWARHNGCDTTMSKAVDPSPCVEYAGCHPGFAVRYCEYDGNLELPRFAATGLWAFFKSL